PRGRRDNRGEARGEGRGGEGRGEARNRDRDRDRDRDQRGARGAERPELPVDAEAGAETPRRERAPRDNRPADAREAGAGQEARAPRGEGRRGPRPEREREAIAPTETAELPEVQHGFADTVPQDGAIEAAAEEQQREGRRRRRGGRGRREREGGFEGAEGVSAEAGLDPTPAADVEPLAVAAAEAASEFLTGAEAGAEEGTPREGEGRRRGRGRDRFRRERREQDGVEAAVDGGTEQVSEAEVIEGEPATPQDLPAAAATPAEPVAAPAAAPVAKAPVAAPPATVPPFVLALDELRGVASQAGLEWVNSDADKVRAAQESIAREPKPARVPRERKPVVALDQGPLVLVETRTDLRELNLPFESKAPHA
ncbi:ribonuclease E/G, partial [Aquabacterium sp. A7-Y]|nr:ribonuclease E/G [Aquabacterium sp. A7-Y]